MTNYFTIAKTSCRNFFQYVDVLLMEFTVVIKRHEMKGKQSNNGSLIVKEFYQDENFKAFDQWFLRFTNGFEILLRRKTHCAQKDPESLSYSIAKFHSNVLRIRRRGTYQMKDIANMHQTLSRFVMNNGKMYAEKESSEVWCATHGSGLDNRQCSVQLTIFADRKPRVNPLAIFRGKGLIIKSKEQDACDRRVQVLFQEKV